MAMKKPLPGDRGSGTPNAVDVHVGLRLRQLRTLRGLSQEKLGEAIGLTFQQVQKYERGANRIGASRLFDISKVLGVEISYFFEDMPAEVAGLSPRKLRAGNGLSEERAHYEQEPDPMLRRETLELVRAYYKIMNPDVRRQVADMVKSMGTASEKMQG